MSQDFILFERQADGTYKRTGELPPKTRYAAVTTPVTVEGSRLLVKKAKDWIEILSQGPLKLAWYKLTPAASPHPMSDEAKKKLREINKQKKETVHVEETV